METDDYSSTFLEKQFADFFREIIQIKRWIEAKRASSSGPDIVADDGAPSPSPVQSEAAVVGQRLSSLLRRQGIEAARFGNEYGFEFYKDAHYMMAALADEIFLTYDWLGKEVWASCLLESALFGSNVAGERVFERIDDLLRVRDPLSRSVAIIYLMSLSLGFQGKFRESGDLSQLDTYRDELFRFYYRRKPELDSESKQISPNAYLHTVSGNPGRKLPHTAKWLSVMAIAMVLFLIVSHVLWRNVAGSVEPVLDQILQEDKAAGANS